MPPWGNLVPGTAEYLAALNEFAVGLTKKKGLTIIKAYVEAARQGWHPEAYELDTDVKEALELAGLIQGATNDSI